MQMAKAVKTGKKEKLVMFNIKLKPSEKKELKKRARHYANGNLSELFRAGAFAFRKRLRAS